MGTCVMTYEAVMLAMATCSVSLSEGKKKNCFHAPLFISQEFNSN
uniref:Uncharacterized protein n=1 Tax=Arundo donax TaxID=35708 RepID=A0A0A9AX78_ARUDO